MEDAERLAAARHGGAHLLAIALVVNGDSGHRVVISVSNDTNGAVSPVRSDSFAPAAKDEGSAAPKPVIKLHPPTVLGLPANALAKLMAPKPALCGQDLEVCIDSLIFVGTPTALDHRTQGEAGTDRSRSTERLTTFTFVFVLKNTCRSLSKWQEVARRAASVWMYEQQRCGYISAQTQHVLDMVQRSERSQSKSSADGVASAGGGAAGKAGAGAAGAASEADKGGSAGKAGGGSAGGAAGGAGGEGAGKGGDGGVGAGEGVEAGEREGLAGEMAGLLAGLQAHGVAHGSVNGWLNLHMRVRPSASALHPRAHHTLLLLLPRHRILASLPPDASLDLVELIRLADPLQNFLALAAQLGRPLQRILALSLHLQHWGKARIVQSVSKASVYLVSPLADLRRGSERHLAFQRFMEESQPVEGLEGAGVTRKFGGERRLAEAVALFSRARTLEEHQRQAQRSLLAHLQIQPAATLTPHQSKLLRATKNDISRVAAWLLEHGLLVELQTYIQFLPQRMSSVGAGESPVRGAGQLLSPEEEAPESPRKGERRRANGWRGRELDALEVLCLGALARDARHTPLQDFVSAQDRGLPPRRALEAIRDCLQVDDDDARDEDEIGQEMLWVEEARDFKERSRRLELVTAWRRLCSASPAPGTTKLSPEGETRLFARLKRMLPLLDGRHTVEEMSAETKIGPETLLSIATRCSDFLVLVRCAI